MEQEDMPCLLLPSPLIPRYCEQEEITQVKCKGENCRNEPEAVSNIKIFSVFNVGTKARHFVCMYLNLQTRERSLHPKAGIGFFAEDLLEVHLYYVFSAQFREKVLKGRVFTSEYVNHIT